MTARKRQLILISTVALGLVALDQVTKAVIRSAIPPGSVTVAGHERTFFYFTHHQNPGLVFGMFHNYPLVAYVAPVLASLVLVYLFKHLDPLSVLQSVAYGMIAGGAIGNLIDRFVFGYVTDFFQVHFWFVPFDFPFKLYPAFNCADSGICIGVVLLVITWHRTGRTHVSSSC